MTTTLPYFYDIIKGTINRFEGLPTCYHREYRDRNLPSTQYPAMLELRKRHFIKSCWRMYISLERQALNETECGCYTEAP